MSRNDVTDIGVDALWQAHRLGRTLDKPPFEIENRLQAYAIQQTVARKLGAGCGWKLGLDKAGNPIVAPLYQGLTYRSRVMLSRRNFNRMLVESELALVFTGSLPPRQAPYDLAEILAATGTIHAAIEIVDSRFTCWPDVEPNWLLADGMSHGCFVLGSGVPFTDRSLLDRGCYKLAIDGETLCQGDEPHPQQDPFASIAWLANWLSEQGRGIRAGDILTTGTFTGVVPIAAGQSATVCFRGIGECSVSVEP